jgi:hypothetical protein
MANYHNAVSDKLVVSFFTEHVIYNVYSKENGQKWAAICSISDSFPKELESSIFSTTHFIVSLTNFTLLPSAEEAEIASYRLNFTLDTQLRTELTEEVAVVYEIPKSAEAVSKQLVNATIESDITLALGNFRKKKSANAIYFYEANNILTVIAVKNGEIHLANRYAVDTMDELFYYVMLVVEQLDLPIDGLYVECTCTKGRHEEYQALFKNYLPILSLTTVYWELKSGENSDNKDIQLLAAFFSQCVL